MKLPSRNYVQVCWVVPDLQQAMEHWAAQAGVGPFFYFDDVHYDNAIYRGEPWQPVKFHAAIAQAGSLQIELVTQLEEGPSMFSELVPPGSSGLHHMSTYTEDFEADLAYYRAAGAEVVFSGLMKGAPVCWLDTVAKLGFMTELMTANPLKEQVFAQFRAAAESWDGKDLVRRVG
ncbi:VOC family protein [Haliea sp. E17]|uniref:VOC family protein n=1 Tax=Haliea sp. E17 TaxID=3401576 RepID=UPI003AAB127F